MPDPGATILEALRLALSLSLPALGIALVVGACVGWLQAATQLAEPSINAIARLIGVGFGLALCARWMGGELLAYTGTLWLGLVGM